MSKIPSQLEPSKRKRSEDSRSYQCCWENKYFVANIDQKTICLICKLVFKPNKVYNIQKHYEQIHKENYIKYTKEIYVKNYCNH